MIRLFSTLMVNYILGKYREIHDKSPKGLDELHKFAGRFTYVDIDDGFVKILGDWEKENIVTLKIPVKNPSTDDYWRISCHKRVEWHVYNIFSEYAAKNYDKQYPIRQLGGFVPRHKLCDPTKSLSLHSYGLAIDINWATNRVGTGGDMPAYVVTLFKQYGWTWGGLWTRPKDPMHFQFYKES